MHSNHAKTQTSKDISNDKSTKWELQNLQNLNISYLIRLYWEGFLPVLYYCHLEEVIVKIETCISKSVVLDVLHNRVLQWYNMSFSGNTWNMIRFDLFIIGNQGWIYIKHYYITKHSNVITSNYLHVWRKEEESEIVSWMSR